MEEIEIKVLGAGCPNCDKLEMSLMELIQALGVEAGGTCQRYEGNCSVRGDGLSGPCDQPQGKSCGVCIGKE